MEAERQKRFLEEQARQIAILKQRGEERAKRRMDLLKTLEDRENVKKNEIMTKMTASDARNEE